MRTFLTHVRIRLWESLYDPFALAVLLFTGLTTLVYWPGLTDPSGAGGGFWFGLRDLSTAAPSSRPPFAGMLDMGVMLLWIFIWPMMAGNVVSGPVAGGRGDAMILKAHPALPIGCRSRAVAEALAVILLVLAVRVPFLFLGEWAHGAFNIRGEFIGRAAFAGRYIEHSLTGSLIMLPTLLAWAAPANHLLVYWLRPLALTALLFAAIQCGLLATLPACIATVIVLSWLGLLSAGRELRLPFQGKKEKGAPETRYRTGRKPESMLRRDQWLKPLSMLCALLAIQAGLFAWEGLIGFPRLGFYFCTVLVFSFMLSLVAMRPLGSNMIAAGISARGGVRPGDFRAAWSVLPVRIEAVIRGVYFHGLIMGLFIWASVIGVNAIHTWLTLGELRLADIDGDSAGKYLLPYISLVPGLAGGLTSAAVGDKVRGFISLGALIGIFVGNLACLILKAPSLLHAAILITLAALGGIPPLVHLGAPRAPPEDERPAEAGLAK